MSAWSAEKVAQCVDGAGGCVGAAGNDQRWRKGTRVRDSDEVLHERGIERLLMPDV